MKFPRVLFVLVIFYLSACNEPQYVHIGPNWAALHDLKAAAQSFEVKVQKVKPEYRVGEAFQFRVSSSRPGRLWVVQVDSKDQVSTLYPNEYLQNNEIVLDQWLEIPPAGVEWSLEADKPVGVSVLAFIVTTGEVDLYEVLGQQGDMITALSLVEQTPSWGLTRKVVKVAESP